MLYKYLTSTLLFLGILFGACSQNRDSIQIGIISDIHYLSEQLMDDGSAIHKYEDQNGKFVTVVPQVLDEVLQDYENSNLNVLLIAGDLTKDGERQSHLDLVQKFRPLQEKGVKIFVVPGNHDINMPNSKGYRGEETYSVPNVSPKEFAEIYADFGYRNAVDRDSSSLSYVAELDPKTWLLAIDACLYKEYKNNSISEGRISADTEKWMMGVLNRARQQNIRIIGLMHHGLVEHIAMQAILLKQYLVDDWQRFATLFADNSVKIFFTGHFHSNDISEYTSSNGNKIYDIETGTLCSYAFPYRFASLEEGKIKITTKNIIAIKGRPHLAEEIRDKMKKLAFEKAHAMIKSRGLNFPEKIETSICEIISEIFILHLKGDESMDNSLKDSLNRLTEDLMDTPTTIDLSGIKLDFPPADNNIEIDF